MIQVALEFNFPERLDTRLKEAMTASRSEALVEALDWWHRRAAPRHFTKAGAALYGYVPRGAKYAARKKKKYGHDDPLVATGDLMRQMLSVKPIPSVRGDVAEARYGGLPYYLTMNQKVSQEQIGEAVGQYGGDLKAAAVALGVTLRTLQRRIQNRVDIHEGSRAAKWKISKQAADKFYSETRSIDVISEWERMHAAAKQVLEAFGGDFQKASEAFFEAFGKGKSAFAKYLRNPNYGGRTSGQTVDKVKELTTITADEMAVMGRVAEKVYERRLAAAGA